MPAPRSLPMRNLVLLLPLLVWAQPTAAQDLRPDAVRTPDERFASLRDFPFEPNYLTIDGLRIHYVDEGSGDAGTFLLLHGEPTWSYLYRKMIPTLVEAGYRVIAPDMVGFGKSDKVVDEGWYTADNHTETLQQLVTRLDLRDVTVVVQDWSGPIGLMTATEMPDRFARLIILNTWLHHPGFEYTEAIRNWRTRSQTLDFTAQGLPGNLPEYRAPFHAPEATVGARRWPWMLPFAEPVAGGAARQERAFRALASWDKPAHVIFGDQDRIFTVEWGRRFAEHIPGATFDVMEGEGHFVQEAGVPLASRILRRIAEEPVDLPAVDVTAAQIREFIDGLPRGVVSDRPIRVIDAGTHRVAVYGVYRPGDLAGDANAHEVPWSEIYYMLSGTGTLVTGGELVNRYRPSAGSTSWRGERVEGGISRPVVPGDVVVIPPYTPHWWSELDGDIEYLIFRPDPSNRMELR